MKVLVCGGRDYQDAAAVREALAMVGALEIITGCAKGADSLAAREAAKRNLPCKVFRADWKTHGRAAGPIRNQEMLDEGKPDLVMAFPGGRGTADMVRRAKAAGVPVMYFHDDFTGAAI